MDFRLSDEQEMFRKSVRDYVNRGVSLFILPTASDGVIIREIPKLGMRALGSCDVFLDDVFVPDENLLGQPDQAWKMLLPTLNSRLFRIGPVTNEMARNSIAEGLGLPRSF